MENAMCIHIGDDAEVGEHESNPSTNIAGGLTTEIQRLIALELVGTGLSDIGFEKL
jgi:hypothetical protein